MLKLLGMDKREGWAFVEDGDRVVLIRPPYQRHDQRAASRSILARAVQDGDFEPKEMEFAGWSSLIQFVKSQIVDHAKQQGRSLDADIGDELIAVAPRVFIERLVDTIEKDLFAAKEWAVAQTLLESILFRSRLMESNDELNKRVRQLLSSVRENQKASAERRERMLHDDSGYKRLKQSGELPSCLRRAQAIRDQGTMFP